MVVTMAIVLMMQVAVHQVVHVIAMRHCFVTAARAVHMARLVGAAGMSVGAAGRVDVIHFQNVLGNLSVLTAVVEVTIVQIVNVVSMLNCRMAAAATVLMGMVRVMIV
ncbi:MAG: hypothetical protein AMXMBFR33_63750 [Candidatus Xenobia bacterium]